MQNSQFAKLSSSNTLFVVGVFLFFCNTRAAINPQENGKIPALFAFGDSILDTGNNNYLNTLSKCNYPPYGRDFNGGIPTGRWGNGRVLSDLIGEALGIKESLPAYLSRNLQSSDLPTGVCFASGGSGCDPITSSIQGGLLSLSDQMRLFKEYIGKLTGVVGEERAKSIISNSQFLLSAGNNDIAIAYSISARRFEYVFPAYAAQLVSWSSSFWKELYALGARRIGVLSTLPLGCLPGARSIGGILGGCIEFTNQEAQMFNSMLSSAVDSFKTSLPDAKIVFVDVYSPLLEVIHNPQTYGFQVASPGCFGGPTSPIACPDAATHVFWDSGHPSEKAYKTIVPQLVQKYFSSSV